MLGVVSNESVLILYHLSTCAMLKLYDLYRASCYLDYLRWHVDVMGKFTFFEEPAAMNMPRDQSVISL